MSQACTRAEPQRRAGLLKGGRLDLFLGGPGLWKVLERSGVTGFSPRGWACGGFCGWSGVVVCRPLPHAALTVPDSSFSPCVHVSVLVIRPKSFERRHASCYAALTVPDSAPSSLSLEKGRLSKRTLFKKKKGSPTCVYHWNMC